MADHKNRGKGRSLIMGQGEEFQEEEVWAVSIEREKSIEDFPKQRKTVSSSSASSAAWLLPLPATSRKMIPRATQDSGNEAKNLGLPQSSAPVKTPDLAHIYGEKIRQIDIQGDAINTDNGYLVENEDGDGDEEMIPPHEYIARRMARTKTASYSMCEGIGRTLKGRDLCKLRNAILTQTGFLEK